jgi:hypothetical protein
VFPLSRLGRPLMAMTPCRWTEEQLCCCQRKSEDSRACQQLGPYYEASWLDCDGLEAAVT